MKIFRTTPLDLILIAYVGIAFIIPFLIVSLTNSIWIWLILMPIHAFLLNTVINTSMHYHMHVPIFRSKFLNRLYEIFVSMTVGIPCQGWKYFHTEHHKHNNSIRDPVSFYRYGINGQRENVWSYCIMGLIRDLTGKNKFDVKNKSLLKVEIYAFWLFLFSIFIINPIYGFIYVVTYLLSLIMNNAQSYGEHYNVIDESNFRNNSVGYYSKFYNILCLNMGYHQEHHVRPSAHWTELPKITKTLPEKRRVINTIYMFNAPWIKDGIELLKGKK
jgi:fatty acid desaturase